MNLGGGNEFRPSESVVHIKKDRFSDGLLFIFNTTISINPAAMMQLRITLPPFPPPAANAPSLRLAAA